MNQIGSEPLKLMMNDEGVWYAWPLDWLCIELFVVKSHVYICSILQESMSGVVFLMTSDFKI